MKHKRVLFVMMGAVAALSLTAQADVQAQSGPDAPDGGAVRIFLPVYIRYVSVVQGHGEGGFKAETAPGFTVRHGHDHWTGTAAFAQAHWWLDGIQGGKVSVTIRRLTISGGTAVAWTREAFTYRSLPGTTGENDLKQTWRRVGDRWELAEQEWVSGKVTGLLSPVEYTVSSDGGPIRTTLRQSVTSP